MDNIRVNRAEGKDYLYDILEQLIVIAEGCGEEETATILREIVASHQRQTADAPLTDAADANRFD